jgi:hypothetical protein
VDSQDGADIENLTFRHYLSHIADNIADFHFPEGTINMGGDLLKKVTAYTNY